MADTNRYRPLETLYVSRDTVIRRAQDEITGTEVILKTLNRSDSRAEDRGRFKHEFELLSSLDLPGIPRALAWLADRNKPTIVLSKAQGDSLTHLYEGSPASLDAFFTIAREAASILTRLHECSILHKDITPDNLIFDRESGAVTLIDFGIASNLPRERRLAAQPVIEGTLAYMAPEQTGRLSHPVDIRTDLYGLGGCLFFILTGLPLFTGEDALELIHAHLARRPRHPSSLRAEVPHQLDAIILKLLEKDSDERYRSAWGLLADLEEIDRVRREPGALASYVFRAGRHDRSAICSISDRLYGRDAEIETLKSLFRDVQSGKSHTVYLVGPAGVGKSALALSLVPTIAATRARFGQGKFEQFARNTELTALATAINGIVDALQTGERALVAESILRDCGANAALVAKISTSTAKLLGELPPVDELNPAESRRRLIFTLSTFLGAITSPQRPLVLFLDDLQWADALSIDLLDYLAQTENHPGILCIVAWRNEEAGQGHLLNALATSGKGVTRIETRSLAIEDIQEMLRDSFGHEEPELSRALFNRTAGNPFFIRHIFSGLVEKGAIRWDTDGNGWSSAGAIPAMSGIGTDVVDILLQGLSQFQAETRRVLAAAACIGSRFDLADVAAVVDAPLFVAARVLDAPMRRELIIPDSADYRYLAALGPEDREPEGLSLPFHFLHDRVQQAASMGISESEKAIFHLRYALILAGLSKRRSDRSKGLTEDNAIELARHLNDGSSAPDAGAFKDLRFEANFRAGRHARASAAFEAAYTFLSIASSLKHEATEASDRRVRKTLLGALAESAYLTGRLDEAEQHIQNLLKLAETGQEKALVRHLQVNQYTTIGRMDDAIESGIEALSLLGFSLKKRPSALDFLTGIIGIKLRLLGWSSERIAAQGPLTDEQALEVIKLLTDLSPAAYLSGNSNLFVYLGIRAIAYSFKRGLSPHVALNWVGFAIILNSALGDLDGGKRIGELGLSLHRKSGDISLKARVNFLYATFTAHWNQSRTGLHELYSVALRSALESGDLLYTAFAATHIHQWNPDWDLERAIREGEHSLALIAATHYQDAWDSTKVAHQLRVVLAGRTPSTGSLDDALFDVEACRARMTASGYTTGLVAFEITMLQLDVIFGSWDTALGHALAARRNLDALAGQPWLLEFWTYGAVAAGSILALSPSSGKRRRAKAFLRAAAVRLARWARHCPANFEAPALLAKAELLLERSGEGNQKTAAKALVLYDHAIETARRNHFPMIEALCCERMALLLFRLGRKRPAISYLIEVYRLYLRLGAKAKLEALLCEWEPFFAEYNFTPPTLDIEAPDEKLAESSATLSGRRTITISRGQSTIRDLPSSIDIIAVLRATQAIAAEFSMDSLLEKLVRIVMENAGADRVLFFLSKNGKLLLRAIGEDAGTSIRVMEGIPASDFYTEEEPNTPPLVLDLLHATVHSRSFIAIEDARTDPAYRDDRRVKEGGVCSLLCVPVMSQGNLIALLYLENSSIPGAFSVQRTELASIIASQIAISLESAFRHDGLLEAKKQLEQAFGRQRELMQAYSRFVPHGLLKLLGSGSAQTAGLGSSLEQELTLLRADLRSIPGDGERLSPLNAIFADIEDVAARHGGFVLDYVGTSALALFPGRRRAALEVQEVEELTNGDGPETIAQEPGSDRNAGADAAIEAAVAIQSRLALLNRRRPPAESAPLEMTISIHTGKTLIGIIGVENHLSATLIADILPETERIMAVALKTGARIVVTESTRAHCLGFERWTSRALGTLVTGDREETIWEIGVENAAPTQP